MSIRYGSDQGELTLGLAQKAGEAIAARQASELAAELQSRREAQSTQMAIAQMENQQQFRMAQLNQEFELQQQSAAKQWDIKKMQIASENDFMYSEQERLAKRQEFDNDVKAYKSAIQSGQLAEGSQEARLALSQVYAKHGMEQLAYQFGKPLTTDEIQAEVARRKLLTDTGEKPTSTPGTPTPTQTVRKYSHVVIQPGQTIPSIFNQQNDQVENIYPDKWYKIEDEKGNIVQRKGVELIKTNPKTGQLVALEVDILGDGTGPITQPTTKNAEVNQQVIKQFAPSGNIPSGYPTTGLYAAGKAKTPLPKKTEVDKKIDKISDVIEHIGKDVDRIVDSEYLVNALLNIKTENKEQQDKITQLMKKIHKYSQPRQLVPKYYGIPGLGITVHHENLGF